MVRKKWSSLLLTCYNTCYWCTDEYTTVQFNTSSISVQEPGAFDVCIEFVDVIMIQIPLNVTVDFVGQSSGKT